MDIRRLKNNVIDRKYYNSKQFLADVRLIYSNSEQFNGSNDLITMKAAQLYDFILKQVEGSFHEKLTLADSLLSVVLNI